MARKFGIITSVENLQAGIVVNSITRNESAEIAEARNEKGADYRPCRLFAGGIDQRSGRD